VRIKKKHPVYILIRNDQFNTNRSRGHLDATLQCK